MRNKKLLYTEPKIDLLELNRIDVITSSYGDYDGTGKDEEYDEIDF